MEEHMLKTSTLAAWAVVAALAVGCGETDAGITTAVKARFAADEVVNAYQIDVDTSDGVVTLTGTVDSVAAEAAALRLARETAGVTRVVNQLSIESAASFGEEMEEMADAVAGATSDAMITAAVKSKMMVDATVAGLKVDVETTDGVVTLRGTVANDGERDRAVAAARTITGVRDVQDELEVRQ
jgi:osmotically-inducible protein OsmY